jgi:tetratricopeptide (TPR) repeat protein
LALFRKKETSQGLPAPEIWVTRAELRSRYPDTMLFAVVGFCRWCTEEAWLIREEVQPDAWMILHSSSYIGEVRNGGHGQFGGNTGMKPEVLDDVEAGLERLGLRDLHAIFRRFRNALDADPALKRKTMEGYGFGDVPDMIRDIDDAFEKSEDPKRFYPRAESWLREAPTVVALSPREIRARQAAILASNKLLDRRRAQARAQASRRSPRQVVVDAVLRLWDKTGLRWPGEHVLVRAMRQIAARPNWAQEVGDALAALIPPFSPAVQDGDHAKVDEILAAYREIHARYRTETTSRWPHLGHYAYQLQYAGERLGRVDLLEQAAEAWNYAIVAGPPSFDYDPGGAWRSLGQTLVELGRLHERHMPAVRKALDAFDRALALDSMGPEKSEIFGSPAADLLGRAEAHLVLATKEDVPSISRPPGRRSSRPGRCCSL